MFDCYVSAVSSVFFLCLSIRLAMRVIVIFILDGYVSDTLFLCFVFDFYFSDVRYVLFIFDCY